MVRAATPPIREGKSSTTCLTHSGQVSSLLALSFSASSVSFTVLSKDFWSARGGRQAGAPAEVEVPTKVPVEAPQPKPKCQPTHKRKPKCQPTHKPKQMCQPTRLLSRKCQ